MKQLRLIELVNKLSISEKQIEDELAKIILSDKEIVRAKQNELKYGVTPERNIIGLYRSPSYRLFKLRKNPLARGTVDLILTGATKRGLHPVKIGRKKYKMVSSDRKWKMLMGKYGKASEGLNDDTFIGLQRKYKVKLNNRLKNKLFA
jgi:hypothetical protein